MSTRTAASDRPEPLTLQEWARQSLGEAIKRRRKREKLTADALAAQCGVGIGQVFRWEAGSNEPTVERLVQIACALGCQVGDLFPPTSTALRMRRRFAEET